MKPGGGRGVLVLSKNTWILLNYIVGVICMRSTQYHGPCGAMSLCRHSLALGLRQGAERIFQPLMCMLPVPVVSSGCEGQ